jgi:uncharacterized protein (TIGR03083 family)
MEHEQFIAVVRDESTALADALRAGGGDVSTPVPSCPGWSIAKLVKHTGTAQRWACTIVETHATEPVSPQSLDLGLGEGTERDANALADWFVDGATRLADVLVAADPTLEVWSWAGHNRAGFWSRRMAHETAMHRWDAQHARGQAGPIDGELSVDGIQERFDNLAGTVARGAAPMTGDGETVHLHCTDRDGEWLVRLAPDGPEITHGHAKGDVAARGSASDLLLMVYGRIPTDAVEVFGDAALLARFQQLAKL